MKGALSLPKLPKQVLKSMKIRVHLLTLWIFSLFLCFLHEGQTSKVSTFLDVCCCFRLHLNGIGWSTEYAARNKQEKSPHRSPMFVAATCSGKHIGWSLCIVQKILHLLLPTTTNSTQPNQLCLAQSRKDEVIFPQWNQIHWTGCNDIVTAEQHVHAANGKHNSRAHLLSLSQRPETVRRPSCCREETHLHCRPM